VGEDQIKKIGLGVNEEGRFRGGKCRSRLGEEAFRDENQQDSFCLRKLSYIRSAKAELRQRLGRLREVLGGEVSQGGGPIHQK